MEEMLEHMKSLKAFSEVMMKVCSDLFLDYCILGGMPAVVRDYIEKGTFEGSLQTQRQLLADYEEGIRKYAEGMDQTRFLNVFRHIPVQLAKDNKKFQISKVASGISSELIPLEVKAVSGRSKSLQTLIASDRYPDIKYGMKLTRGNIGYSGKIFTFPHFCCFLLKRYLKSAGASLREIVEKEQEKIYY